MKKSAVLRQLAQAAPLCMVMGLTACSSDDDAAQSTPFTQALSKNYTTLATEASALPAEPSESSFLDSLNPFSSSDTNSETLAKAFTAKADMASSGTEPEPEAGDGPGQNAARTRLLHALTTLKTQFPDQAARAQADYDCWIVYGAVSSAAAASQACKKALDSSLIGLETASRDTPPSAAPEIPSAATSPPPPVVQMATAPTAQPAPPASAPATREFTVYFDFDSWTLKAEQLKVLTEVISAARTGGQSSIVIVGHTDTSGSARYNQRLSVRRAHVTEEALADMGARRPSLHASGVGETDLAVQTGDGVREPKNRRTVVTLEP